MKIKRVIGGICLLTMFAISTPSSAMAEEVQLESSVAEYVCAEIGSLDSQEYSVSEVMTFEEMLQVMLSNECDQVNGGSKYAAEYSLHANTSRAATYRVLSVNVAVNDLYYPRIDFYCETNESSGSFTIENIYSVGLNRSFGGLTKQYDGYIHAYIRSGNSIEYWMYGSFYNTGTTSVASRTNGSTTLNQMYNITYTASNTAAANKYANCGNHNTRTFA